MAHQQQRDFVEKVKSKNPSFFRDKKVLEVGSLNINGTLRDFFQNCDYTGIDVGEGPGVDLVCYGENYDAPDNTYDVVCSGECFEHNPKWLETFENMIRMCKKGGLVFFTCASEGRPEHGTTRTDIESSPFTAEWNYYRNLNEIDFTSKINFDNCFDDYQFEYNPVTCDLYFFGTKKSRIKKIVDFFPYFDPTGRELLELRINMLKDYVDEFVICESNKTQSGIPIEYNLRNVIREYNLPSEKIKIIDLDIPEEENLEIKDIDVYNCSENYDFENIKNGKNLNSIRARVRERMQKDSILSVLDQYDDDTVFIHSDSDEIIKPESIEWIASVVKENQNNIIKIPLVHLEGRADLRVYYKDTNIPKPWDGGMFLATKKQLKICNPSSIRSNVLNKFPINYLVQDGNIIQDLGWHFSWMGDVNKRIEKSKAFCHYDDEFSFLSFKKYGSEESIKSFYENEPEEGSISPSGVSDSILKKYPKNEIPKEVFNLSRVKAYLLPTYENQYNFSISSDSKKILWIVDNFYERPDEVREFALNQEYVEGGFGRGFIGRRTEKQFLFPGLKEKFEEIIGMEITEWESHGMNGRFQNAHAGEPLVWHCDSQKWGGMLYLTPDAPYQCGTTLYAHKKTRARSYYDEGWDAAWKDIPGDPHLDGTPFEPVDVLGNVYNRLVIFDASNIHSASEYFGTVMENSRLWQMFFFDT
jgi:SAM-dependent methyltransferase